ncbi:MAG: hypothetical protein C5B59_06760 [Bacteroidetes bacterium]|nr:MAG: hypothetical protein C5B59_06760 [Bacteroidota bacterium]
MKFIVSDKLPEPEKTARIFLSTTHNPGEIATIMAEVDGQEIPIVGVARLGDKGLVVRRYGLDRSRMPEGLAVLDESNSDRVLDFFA